MGTRPGPSNIFDTDLPNDHFYFQFGCATELCTLYTANGSVSAFREYSVGLNGSNVTSWYQGGVGYADRAFSSAGIIPKNTSTVPVLLADFSSVTGPIANLTIIPKDSVAATAEMFNVSLPTINGLHCSRTFAKVEVDAIFSRGKRPDANETGITLPWAVSAYMNGT